MVVPECAKPPGKSKHIKPKNIPIYQQEDGEDCLGSEWVEGPKTEPGLGSESSCGDVGEPIDFGGATGQPGGYGNPALTLKPKPRMRGDRKAGVRGGVRRRPRGGRTELKTLGLKSDSGAEANVWGKDCRDRIYDVRPLLRPLRLTVAGGGMVEVRETGTMMVEGMELTGFIMPDSPLSLVSVDDIVGQGWRYVQEAQEAWYERGDGSRIELEREGKLWVFKEESLEVLGVHMGPIPKPDLTFTHINRFAGLPCDEEVSDPPDSSLIILSSEPPPKRKGGKGIYLYP